MKKYFFLILSIAILTACHNNENNVQFSILQEQIIKSIEHLNQDSKAVQDEMERKMKDPQTKAKAEIWYPRMKEVLGYTNQIINHVDSLTKKLKTQQRSINKREEIELYQQLVGFEKNVKNAVKPEEFSDNPLLSRYISRKRDELSLATFAKLSSDKDRQNQLSSYFNNTNMLGSITMLYKIQLDAMDYCYGMTTYFDVMSRSYRDMYYESFASIATLSSSYLKKGQSLTIYAGMGVFSRAAQPSFTINGKKISVNEEGLAIDKLIIDKQPGDYSIPVTVKFTAPDGRSLTKSTTLKYTVAN